MSVPRSAPSPAPLSLPITRSEQDESSPDREPSSQAQGQNPPSWADDRILLTPPIPMSTVNPLEQELYRDNNSRAFQANQHARLQNAQVAVSPGDWLQTHHDTAHLLSGLHIRTDLNVPKRSNSNHSMDSEPRLRSSASASSLPRRIPSVRTNLHSSAGSVSPGTVISSPQLAAMLDITPLPSPTMAAFESWKALSRTRSRGSSISSLKAEMAPAAFSSSTLSPTSPRRKGYPGLKSRPPSRSGASDDHGPSAEHTRTRSVSDYVPEALAVLKPRNVVVSTGAPLDGTQSATGMHREEYLGPQRGLSKDKTPVIPNHSDGLNRTHEDEPAAKRPKLEILEARSISRGEPRSYEIIRQLGQGTFSKVYLAVRQVQNDGKDSVDYRQDSVNMAGVRARSRRLVAIKVVEHGPAGGADAERIEVGLKREVDLLKSIQHPSLVHLKAFGNDGNARALLVMNYCPGGDLFEVATKHRDVLTPSLVRRIFSELVSAARYLHQKYIVHRDIKLESTCSTDLSM